MRVKRNLSQEELALRARVSRQTIMSIEQERTYPSVYLACKIAGVLRAPLHELFFLEEAPLPGQRRAMRCL